MSNPVQAINAANATAQAPSPAAPPKAQATTQTAAPQDKVTISPQAQPALASQAKPATSGDVDRDGDKH
jgi:hypothetical protein